MTKRTQGASGLKPQTLFVIFPLLVGVVLLAATAACGGRSAWDRVFDDPARLPAGTEAAIVLGTAPRLEDGTPERPLRGATGCGGGPVALGAGAPADRLGEQRRARLRRTDGDARRVGAPRSADGRGVAGPGRLPHGGHGAAGAGVFDVGNGGAAVFVTDPFHAPRTLVSGGPGGRSRGCGDPRRRRGALAAVVALAVAGAAGGRAGVGGCGQEEEVTH